ncbi:S49 family peptidase [Pseudooceanicola sp.]|uniref:S49 family peptidase n=1 Tax=Pseudooceanicola sp. TaxID=1914328 RepID=UPI0026038AA5|nr:S49 family peptidase [Pseudooceanicola sp.]MDF1854562.1 S49 family peptidase [Pseudooceanicola sp.]
MFDRLPFLNRAPSVAVIRLKGLIASGARGPLNDQLLAPTIERAFRRGKPVAVALLINSPGGSPVQSSLIAARIRRLAAERSVPVFAFVEDVAASGGYWLACAADEIHADESSVIGSIGVISSGFGAQIFLSRQGIERRVHTAGKSKSMLDPFRPEDPQDVEKLEALLGDIHTSFINHVKARRGDRLKPEVPLFEGEVWLGRRAQDLGLIDGISHLVPFMKARFGDKVRFRQYGPRRGIAQRLGAAVIDDALGGIEERAAFARFGL